LGGVLSGRVAVYEEILAKYPHLPHSGASKRLGSALYH
jgi:hypothetical protein